LKKIAIALIDYNVGNLASVVHSLRGLDFRVTVTEDSSILDESDVVILPGVGAYTTAMLQMRKLGLIEYLQTRAQENKPIIGICLGMQLLTEGSHEHQHTEGLGIIPGVIVPLKNTDWHIGWNTLECTQQSNKLKISTEETFYFNHSYIYSGPAEYQVYQTEHHSKFASVIRNQNTIGLQFHPEKSQMPGKKLLLNLIYGVVEGA
jgi:imidazole glycerol-phosphate synthase subunit HisH